MILRKSILGRGNKKEETLPISLPDGFNEQTIKNTNNKHDRAKKRVIDSQKSVANLPQVIVCLVGRPSFDSQKPVLNLEPDIGEK